jgi:hypothetical protein
VSDDREKLSFSERDRLLRERGRGDAPPRGQRAQEESRRATATALREADQLFAGEGGPARARAQAVRDAHGSDSFLDACRSYLAEVGAPEEPSLIALFLDTGDRELMVPVLEVLLRQQGEGTLEISPGLRSQLRVLEQHRDDTVAGIAEDLLAG